MPAVSRKQRIAMAIAEHEPEKLYKRNRSMLSMSQKQLYEFASTSEKNLPARKHGRGPDKKPRKKPLKHYFGGR